MVDVTVNELTALIEELRSEIRELSERVALLESPGPAAAARPKEPEPTAAAPAPPVVEELSEELMLVISAAVAAYLGVRAHIRQVRLIRSPAWAQQGRVSIQASHHLLH